MGITPYTIQYTRIAYLFHNSSLLILYPWFVPPRFPLPFGNHKFVFCICESETHYSLKGCNWDHGSLLFSLSTSEFTGCWPVCISVFSLTPRKLRSQSALCLECIYKTFMAWISVFKFMLLINLNFPFILFSSFKKSILYSVCYFLTKLPFV